MKRNLYPILGFVPPNLPVREVHPLGEFEGNPAKLPDAPKRAPRPEKPFVAAHPRTQEEKKAYDRAWYAQNAEYGRRRRMERYYAEKAQKGQSNGR